MASRMLLQRNERLLDERIKLMWIGDQLSSFERLPCSCPYSRACASKSEFGSLESVSMSFQNPVFIACYAVALWAGVSFLISLIGGWYELGRIYRTRQTFDGQIWRFQDAQFRLIAGYHNILSVGVNSEGLYLSVFLP